MYIFSGRSIGIVVRVFSNGPGDMGSIPDRVIAKSRTCLIVSIKYESEVIGGTQRNL